MTNSSSTSFDASSSALGYLYQLRYALLMLIKQAKKDLGISISIEKIDDIALIADLTPIEAIQTKLHGTPADLTDASADIWKTLRVWIEGVKTATFNPDETIFTLVTTNRAVDGTAAGYLRADDEARDIKAAQRLLQAAAANSRAKKDTPTDKAYKAFQALTSAQQLALLSSVYVIDESPGIADVLALLYEELKYMAPRKSIKDAVDAIEGWWFRVVVDQLRSNQSRLITAQELDMQIDDVREQFKRESLPVEFLAAEPTEPLPDDGSMFIQQLALLQVNLTRRHHAIRDYRKAFVQRGRWHRMGLLRTGEVDDYETRLFNEWQLKFGQAKDDLPASPVEADNVRIGRELLKWVEGCPPLYIRETCTAEYVVRGSFHILADKDPDDTKLVGWHPDFKNRLAPSNGG
jgi:hypothetical protein